MKERLDLPDFVFPVIAWAPEPATGDPDDDGTRSCLTPRDLSTIYFPETDLRQGWTFVDAEGRSWQVLSSRVTGRADPWWTRRLPQWMHHPRYRLAYSFAERPQLGFEAVKSRLFAAVAVNPEAYGGGDCEDRRQELRDANSLSDLIKSDEARAIERLEPRAWWWQWLLGEGRCSRLGFLAALAGVAAVWLAVSRFVPVPPVVVGMIIASAFFVMSAVARRLHDLKLSGWWLAAWWMWTMLCALIHDVYRDAGGPGVAGWLWWGPNLCLFGWLAVWPGARGANRYGYAPSRQHP